MQKLKNILVAIDFSDKADNAILKAASIAKNNNAKVTLLYVAKKDTSSKWIAKLLPSAKKIFMTPKEYATISIKNKIKEFASLKLKMKGVVLMGDPAKKILQYAKKQKIDLIVMGARGKYSIQDWFVGTTTEVVAKTTTIPVLIVKKYAEKKYNHVLVPVDFSAPSKLAFEFAMNYITEAKLELLHVIDHEYEDWLKKEKSQKVTLRSLRRTIIDSLKTKLDHFIKKVTPEKIGYKIKVGYPSLEISKQAAKQHADLIIMGTSGHSKRYYVLLGRVATMVLYEVDADILLIPPKK